MVSKITQVDCAILVLGSPGTRMIGVKPEIGRPEET
jgi:hypothetical protein